MRDTFFEFSGLEDLPNQGFGSGTLRDVVSAIAFVRTDTALADAQARTNAVRGAQDVLATKFGMPTEAMEGWITNADIAKVASV